MSYLVDFEVLFYGKNIAKKTFVFLAVLEFSVANAAQGWTPNDSALANP
jgi:hypothetical protein